MENKEIKLSHNAIDIIEIENTLEHRILSDQTILNDIKNNYSLYLVYYENNISIGYLAFSNCIDHIDIISIATKPSYRRKGIAKALLKHLETYNTEKLNMFLEVRASNLPAINLYTSLGLKCIDRRKYYYSEPAEDALIYFK